MIHSVKGDSLNDFNVLSTFDALCFTKQIEWAKWKQSFEQFHVASRLSDKSNKQQASTLLYCFGADAEDILFLSTTNIIAVYHKKYQRILEKFDVFLLWEET